MMDETTQIRGTLTFEDKVIAKITRMSIRDIDGLLGMDGGVVDTLTEAITQDERIMKGIKVNVGEKQAAIELAVILAYDADARQVFTAASSRIEDALRRMTGLRLVALNINVTDIMTQREWRKSQS